MANKSENVYKSQSLKITLNSGSESDDSEHELSYYMKDKVKLMKEVLKLIKPKKIKSMAPECIKHLDIVEINSMLLEELLGISNKRLQYIFNGENVDRETSSSDSDEEKKPIDIISLDDISDEDISVTINTTEKGQHKRRKKNRLHKIKRESVNTTKKQKDNKIQNASNNDLKESEKQKLMSVLELLELQARARAIKSQLVLESNKKLSVQEVVLKDEDDSDPDAVIIESPTHSEIILMSSDSEDSIIITDDNTETGNCLKLPEICEKSVSAPTVIMLDDENQQPSSSKIVLHLKKQKLFSRAKKIKLKRYKSVAHDAAGTVQNAHNMNVGQQVPQNLPNIRKNELTPAVTGEAGEMSLQNMNNDQQIENRVVQTIPDIGENEQAPLVTGGDCKAEVNLSDIPIPKDKSVEENESNDNQIINPAFEIDNDEIVVIHLDEDEMKGIEND